MSPAFRDFTSIESLVFMYLYSDHFRNDVYVWQVVIDDQLLRFAGIGESECLRKAVRIF